MEIQQTQEQIKQEYDAAPQEVKNIIDALIDPTYDDLAQASENLSVLGYVMDYYLTAELTLFYKKENEHKYIVKGAE
jgi:predicted lipoprotein